MYVSRVMYRVCNYLYSANKKKKSQKKKKKKKKKESTESRKTLEQRFIFQIGTLNPHGINERFSFN